MANEIEKAVRQICEEKGIALELVIETINAALAAAYRKDFADKTQNIKVNFDLKTGSSEVFDVKTVVEDQPEESEVKLEVINPVEGEEIKRFNPKTEIQISDAKKIDKKINIGEELRRPLTIPDAYGRMAAQTAKQVIIQKLREAERDMQYNAFKSKEHTVVMGTVQRRDMRNVYIDVDRVATIMPRDEQIEKEPYRTGDRLKVYVKSVEQTNRGPEIIVSRASNKIVEAVFANEIPEIASGVIEIKSIAREAGFRSKIAVSTNDANIDPIGSCVGQRGTRVQTIISELGGEKVDIISYDNDQVKYITNALAPAKLTAVVLKEESKIALVTVVEDQLSLAIGRSGQNVRLASKLTGWTIEIKPASVEKLVEEDKISTSDVQDKDGELANEIKETVGGAIKSVDEVIESDEKKTKDKKTDEPDGKTEKKISKRKVKEDK